MIRRATLVAASASLDGGGERLLQVASALGRSGLDVELVVLDDGPGLLRFREVGPTSIIGTPRATGRRSRVAALATASRHRAERRIGRADVVLTVPSVLPRLPELLGRHRPPVVAVVPRCLGSCAPGPAHLAYGAVRGWILADDAGSESAPPTGRSIIVAPIWDPTGIAPARDPRPGSGAIAVLASPDLWNQVDHSIELLNRLSERLASTRLRLVVPRSEQWYCQHDLRHAGLSDHVAMRAADQPSAVDGCSVVVNAGYSAASRATIVGAVAAGIPVAGFRGTDLPVDIAEVEPLDVAGLADLVVQLDRLQPEAPPAVDDLRREFDRRSAEVGRFVAEVTRG